MMGIINRITESVYKSLRDKHTESVVSLFFLFCRGQTQKLQADGRVSESLTLIFTFRGVTNTLDGPRHMKTL